MSVMQEILYFLTAVHLGAIDPSRELPEFNLWQTSYRQAVIRWNADRLRHHPEAEEAMALLEDANSYFSTLSHEEFVRFMRERNRTIAEPTNLFFRLREAEVRRVVQRNNLDLLVRLGELSQQQASAHRTQLSRVMEERINTNIQLQAAQRAVEGLRSRLASQQNTPFQEAQCEMAELRSQLGARQNARPPSRSIGHMRLRMPFCGCCQYYTHSSETCPVYATIEDRVRRMNYLRLCPRCLARSHAICNRRCRRCRGQHHESICPRFQMTMKKGPQPFQRPTNQENPIARPLSPAPGPSINPIIRSPSPVPGPSSNSWPQDSRPGPSSRPSGHTGRNNCPICLGNLWGPGMASNDRVNCLKWPPRQ